MRPKGLRARLGFAGWLIAAGAAAAQEPPPADPDLPRLHRISAEIVTSAQPSSEGLAKLQLRGYRAVMSLRLEEEGALEERLVVEKLGMEFIHLPVRDIDADAVQRFGQALRAAPRPLLIHGDSGNRVGALWMIERVLEGAALGEARAEAEAIGLVDSELTAQALATLNRLRRSSASQPSGPPSDPP